MMIDRRTLLAAVPAVLIAGTARAEEVHAKDVEAPIRAFEKAFGGRVGVFAENLKTGAKMTWRADQRFVMCSSFKASLVACVLARVDRGLEHLDRIVPFGPGDLLEYAPVARENVAKGGLPVEMLCRAAVEVSDNTCANLLLTSLGGPAALTAFWRSVGDATTRLDHFEPELNRSPPGDPHDTTTPAAMAGTLRHLILGKVLAPASRERLTGWMLDCKTGRDLLRAGLPEDWRVGDKTGNNGRDAMGDIAVAWPAPDRPIVVCAYAQGGQPPQERLRPLFAEIGRMVAGRLA